MSCISRPKQPLGWGSPCHRLHMNSLRYSCYLLTIDQVSTDHRPSVDQLLTDTSVKYRRTIGELSANCRWSIIERKTISAETHLERLSTVSRPSVVRLSSESRPAIDRVSTDYRPLYRLIDCLTLPTVNMIHFRSSADKVSCLKMISNESTSLRKTFSIKIMTVFPWDIPHSNSFLF